MIFWWPLALCATSNPSSRRYRLSRSGARNGAGRFLSASSDAVHLFGPAAGHGAYVAQTPTLDMTPAPQEGGVVRLALIVDGVRFACLTRLPADPRRLDRPGIPCPPLERLSPDEVDRVEALKPPRAIELFGRDGAAGAIIVILKRHR